MNAPLASRYKIIDIDTHVVEPYDLWTSRVSVKKFGAKVPYVSRDANGVDFWFFNEQKLFPAASFAQAGYREFPPNHPKTLDDARPETWDAHKRLKTMDDYGIYAEVLFPNFVGLFGSAAILSLQDTELMLDIIRAYNDWQVDWASADPKRLLPQAALPVWDVDLAVAEMQRCRKNGHRGIVVTDVPHEYGQPRLTSLHWDRMWAAAQDLGMPVNFHIGSGDIAPTSTLIDKEAAGPIAAMASQSTLLWIGNAKALVQIIAGGICHRYPKLNFVSVESGVGWVPFALHALDWQWRNTNVWAEHPDYLTPVEYFRRQIYASFWFERPVTLLPAIEVLGEDNILYETDFPHPTSMSPGPGAVAQNPKDYIEEVFKGMPETTVRKILHDNAARIYHLD
jgi:predicted TIM-barrel fold metal-dependent hydrolase